MYLAYKNVRLTTWYIPVTYYAKLYDINSIILMTDSDNHIDKEKEIRLQMTLKKSRIITGKTVMRTMQLTAIKGKCDLQQVCYSSSVFSTDYI